MHTLSTKVYTSKEVDKLFMAFIGEASLCLIFLKSLKHIEIQRVGNMKKNKETFFSVHIPSEQNTAVKERTKFRDFINQCYAKEQLKLPENSIESKYSVSFKENRGGQSGTTSTEFDVYNFFIGKSELSGAMKKLLLDEKIACLPIVGIAFPRKSEIRNFCPHVFCFLPLPYDTSRSLTGLSMHVNGYFAISPDRRHVELTSADISDKDVEWNRCLIQDVLPVAFSNFIKSEIQQNNVVYHRLPIPSKVDENWRFLLEPLFREVLKLPIFQTVLGKSVWNLVCHFFHL